MGDSMRERERETVGDCFLTLYMYPGKGSLPIRLSQGGDFASFGLLIALVIESAAQRGEIGTRSEHARARACRRPSQPLRDQHLTHE